MKKFMVGDLVRNPFGVIFEIIAIDKYCGQVQLKNRTVSWHEFDEVEAWDLFRKV